MLQPFFLSSLVHHLDMYRVRLPAYILQCMDTLELKRQILLYDTRKQGENKLLLLLIHGTFSLLKNSVDCANSKVSIRETRN